MGTNLRALPDEIRNPHDRTAADLIAAHDYFPDTQAASDLFLEYVPSTPSFSIDNEVTGTVTTGADLSTRSEKYVKGRLPEANFQQFIAIFEGFVFDFLHLWLKPLSLPTIDHPECE